MNIHIVMDLPGLKTFSYVGQTDIQGKQFYEYPSADWFFDDLKKVFINSRTDDVYSEKSFEEKANESQHRIDCVNFCKGLSIENKEVLEKTKKQRDDLLLLLKECVSHLQGSTIDQLNTEDRARDLIQSIETLYETPPRR